MLAVFVLAGNFHAIVELKAMKLFCRIIFFISFFLTWLIKTVMEKQVFTVVGDNEPPFVKDYLLDEELMESFLFKSVLDHHSNFIPIASYKKPTTSRADRKKKKYTKLFADNCKKKS